MSKEILNDLSDYEKIRLANINRNLEFLKNLGLVKPVVEVKKEEKKIEDLAKIKKRKIQSIKPEINLQNVRRSARLRAIDEIEEEIKLTKDNDEEPIEEDTGIDYEQMPLDSEDLDDFEFQVFVLLKAWRLQLCRELDIEPYKIFPNRAMAEFIRRKRNDSKWLYSSKSSNELVEDLLSCWGIGPSKAKVDGFGYQMMKLMHDNFEQYNELFNQSRNLSSVSDQIL